jgi:molybdopterin-guanine dinucleotide biosynthesis protein B
MKRIHIVGRKNHGKTTLIVELIGELTRIGQKVGVIKHSSHKHELDTPGKDSHRQRLAGASPVSIVSDNLIGIYMPRSSGSEFYESLKPLYRNCDLVLVEGHIDGSGPKLEVWRSSAGEGGPLAENRSDIAAVITDDQAKVSIPVWSRSDIERLAERLGRFLEGNGQSWDDGPVR